MTLRSSLSRGASKAPPLPVGLNFGWESAKVRGTSLSICFAVSAFGGGGGGMRVRVRVRACRL